MSWDEQVLLIASGSLAIPKNYFSVLPVAMQGALSLICFLVLLILQSRAVSNFKREETLICIWGQEQPFISPLCLGCT